MRVYKRAGSRYYWCEGRHVDGSKWWESTKQTTRAAATVAGRELERRRLLAADQAESPATIGDAVNAIAAEDVRANRPAGTREYHATKCRHVVAHFGKRTRLARLDAVTLRAYADQRLAAGASQHTVHKELTVIGKGARLVGCPIAREARPELGRVYVPRDRWLPVDEYRRLLLALAPHRRDWLIALCHTGVRWSELESLTARDVDVPGRKLHVRGTKTIGSVRTVPLDADALEVLARRAAERPRGRLFPRWHKHNVHEMLDRACKRVGIAAVDPNDCRRTFCSWLAQSGVTELECARLLGNSSTMVRRVYAQLAVTHLEAAIARLPTVTATQTASQTVEAECS